MTIMDQAIAEIEELVNTRRGMYKDGVEGAGRQGAALVVAKHCMANYPNLLKQADKAANELNAGHITADTEHMMETLTLMLKAFDSVEGKDE